MALNHQSLYAMKWQADACPDYVSISLCLIKMEAEICTLA